MYVLMVNKYFSWLAEHEFLKQQQNKIYPKENIHTPCGPQRLCLIGESGSFFTAETYSCQKAINISIHTVDFEDS